MCFRHIQLNLIKECVKKSILLFILNHLVFNSLNDEEINWTFTQQTKKNSPFHVHLKGNHSTVFQLTLRLFWYFLWNSLWLAFKTWEMIWRLPKNSILYIAIFFYMKKNLDAMRNVILFYIHNTSIDWYWLIFWMENPKQARLYFILSHHRLVIIYIEIFRFVQFTRLWYRKKQRYLHILIITSNSILNLNLIQEKSPFNFNDLVQHFLKSLLNKSHNIKFHPFSPINQ